MVYYSIVQLMSIQDSLFNFVRLILNNLYVFFLSISFPIVLIINIICYWSQSVKRNFYLLNAGQFYPNEVIIDYYSLFNSNFQIMDHSYKKLFVFVIDQWHIDTSYDINDINDYFVSFISIFCFFFEEVVVQDLVVLAKKVLVKKDFVLTNNHLLTVKNQHNKTLKTNRKILFDFYRLDFLCYVVSLNHNYTKNQ